MFTLPKLGYEYDALEPYFDALTMEIHHTKHHQTYVDKLNAIINANPNLNNKKLEELVTIPETKNMAGGHYNHSFFWEILRPSTGQKILKEIAVFKDEFTNKALNLFGSGWIWLAKKNEELTIVTTQLQDSPLTLGATPILGLDLWEHAYYLKYQNRRSEYIDAFWNIVNWDKVNKLLKS